MFTQKNVQSTQHARLGNWNVAGGLHILKLGFLMSNPKFAWVMNFYCINMLNSYLPPWYNLIKSGS